MARTTAARRLGTVGAALLLIVLLGGCIYGKGTIPAGSVGTVLYCPEDAADLGPGQIRFYPVDASNDALGWYPNQGAAAIRMQVTEASTTTETLRVYLTQSLEPYGVGDEILIAYSDVLWQGGATTGAADVPILVDPDPLALIQMILYAIDPETQQPKVVSSNVEVTFWVSAIDAQGNEVGFSRCGLGL
jgi:hypothetical protein